MRDEIADGRNDRTLIKTQDYLEVFARFKQKENIEAVERMLLQKDELELFERSQLGIYSTR
jgi:DNA-directed RNA polymerase II subunit RPB4